MDGSSLPVRRSKLPLFRRSGGCQRERQSRCLHASTVGAGEQAGLSRFNTWSQTRCESGNPKWTLRIACAMRQVGVHIGSQCLQATSRELNCASGLHEVRVRFGHRLSSGPSANGQRHPESAPRVQRQQKVREPRLLPLGMSAFWDGPAREIVPRCGC